MNTRNLTRTLCAAVFITSASFNLATAAPIGTAFTYQGQLQQAGQPASGLYDFEFKLYDAPANGSLLTTAIYGAVAVNNGLFNVTVDFGPGQFLGQARWLDISVRTNRTTSFTPLTPRQELTPAPHALHAAEAAAVTGPVAAGQLTGTIAPANIANGTITAGMLAPGAVNHLDAPGGSPDGALAVNTNGLVGIGTTNPAAGLQISTGASILAPTLLAEVVDGTGSFTNLAPSLTLATCSNLVAVGSSSDNSVTLLNIDNPSNPAFLFTAKDGSGSFTNLTSVVGVALSSSLLAVASYAENAVTLVDVSNPSAPVWRARLIDGISSFNEIGGAAAVLLLPGDILAIAAYSDSAVSLVDVSNPANPVLRGLMKDGFNGFTNLGAAKALAAQGNLLAIAGSSDHAVTLADVSDPSNPLLRASLKNGVGGYLNLNAPNALALANNLLAIASDSLNAVTLVDVTAPANPVLRASIQNGQNGFEGLDRPYSLVFQGTTLWVAANNGAAVTAIDVSNPAAPVLKCVLRNGSRGFNRLQYPYCLAISGNNILVGAYNALTVFNGTTTASASLLARDWVGIGTETPLAALHVKGDVIAETSSFSIQGNGAAIHTGSVGRFGAAAGWKPNTNSTSESGIWIEGGAYEGGGFYADGDMAAIWSPGDADILRVYDEDDFPGGPRFVINPSGKVGVLTNNPQTALHVAGIVTADGVKFRDGSAQSTAAVTPGFYSASGLGASPATTNNFLAPTATITITNASQKVLVTSFKALGSTSAGGASGLNLYIGYRLVGSTAAPTISGSGIMSARVPANTRIPMGLSYVITGLTPGQYNVGLTGYSADAANWNYNEYGSTTAVEL